MKLTSEGPSEEGKEDSVKEDKECTTRGVTWGKASGPAGGRVAIGRGGVIRVTSDGDSSRDKVGS